MPASAVLACSYKASECTYEVLRLNSRAMYNGYLLFTTNVNNTVVTCVLCTCMNTLTSCLFLRLLNAHV